MGLHVFLKGILDYAGLFPPAGLPLEPAIRNYAGYARGPQAWLLSRFICPTAKLAELGRFVSLFDGATLHIAALGRAGQSGEDFLTGLKDSLTHVAAFRAAHAGRVSVEAIELPLPPNLQSSNLVARAAGLIESAGLPRLTPFFEVTTKENWRAATAAAIDAIASHNARWHGAHGRPAGFKLRTGGTTADAFPSTEQVAFAVTACRDRGVAMKCTAGLHHPVRRFDASVQMKMHGFVNVFGAGVLAHALSLSLPDVHSILEDEDASHFCFDSDGFAWQGFRASLQEIEAARQRAIISFGSCSFDEPLDDLRALHLL